ncbi:MAG: VanZ family protein, partial [Oscillospiraceae bacterium]|nr:VanZ family protein [Candidatus Equicaccousia limihippi]
MRTELINCNLFKKANYWLSLTLVMGVMTAIFWFSSKDATVSGEQSGGITHTIINIFMPWFNNLSAANRESFFHTFDTVVRKIGHFSEYFILGAVLTYHIKTIALAIKKRFRLFAPLIVGAVYAFTDELHQLFVPGRA